MRNKCVPHLLQSRHPILGHKECGSLYLQYKFQFSWKPALLLSESEWGYFSPEAWPGAQEWGSGPKAEQRGC